MPRYHFHIQERIVSNNFVEKLSIILVVFDF